MIPAPQLTKFFTLSGKRGHELAAQVQALLLFDSGVAVDINSLLSAVLSFAQGYARAMTNALAWVMADVTFPSLPLRQQAVCADQAQLWEALFSGIGAVAHQKRLSTNAVFSSSPSQQFFSASDRGIAVSVALEQVIGAANRSGVSFTLFWTSTAAARLALSRLTLFDAVLETTPVFDPFADALRMLREAAPLSPDVTPLIARLNKDHPTGLLTQKRPRALAYTVRQGDTLELIAQRTIGQASQWRTLADFNHLRYPFISEDITLALGNTLLSLALATATVIGAYTLTCIDVIGVQQSMRIRLRWNTRGVTAATGGVVAVSTGGFDEAPFDEAPFDEGPPDEAPIEEAPPVLPTLGVQPEQIVTVVSVNLITKVITVLEALTVAFPITAEISVYLSESDTQGQVFTSGSTLLIPIFALTNGGASLQGGVQTVTTTRLYGTDLMEREEDLVIEDGDLKLVAGYDNLKQALQHRFLVEMGSLAYHPTYGTGLLTYIGLKNAAYFHFLASIEARQTVLRDPRVATVDHVSGEVEPDALNFDVSVTTAAFEQFPPLQLTVAI